MLEALWVPFLPLFGVGLTGQMYQHGTLVFSGGEATLDLNQLPKGSYILVLEAEEKRYRARVVVSP